MILLDTVVLLRMAHGERIRIEALSAINRAANARELLLSAISVWEFDTLVRKTGRTGPSFGPNPRQWLATALKSVPARLIPFEFDDALALMALPPEVHNDPADRMLIASARRRNIPIVTDDNKIVKLAKAGVLAVVVC
jgi:PIN domain nuclease of toxin-antitoxin system